MANYSVRNSFEESPRNDGNDFCTLRRLAALVINQAVLDLKFYHERKALSLRMKGKKKYGKGVSVKDVRHPDYNLLFEDARQFLTAQGAAGTISRYWFNALDMAPLSAEKVESLL